MSAASGTPIEKILNFGEGVWSHIAFAFGFRRLPLDRLWHLLCRKSLLMRTQNSHFEQEACLAAST